jgi:low affinity Fe/Cu permease
VRENHFALFFCSVAFYFAYGFTLLLMMQAVAVGVIARLLRFARTGVRNFLYMRGGMAVVMISRVLALRHVVMSADRLYSRKR